MIPSIQTEGVDLDNDIGRALDDGLVDVFQSQTIVAFAFVELVLSHGDRKDDVLDSVRLVVFSMSSCLFQKERHRSSGALIYSPFSQFSGELLIDSI